MERDKEIISKIKFHKSAVDKIALWLTDTFGSMTFLFLCFAIFIIWILWNLRFFHSYKPFDPYPFPMLTMMVSLFAIVLSVTVLISQNRSRKLEDKRQQLEFEVSVLSEKEITKMLVMLHDIQLKLGMTDTADKELEEMKETLNLQDLHETLNEFDKDS